MEKLFVKDTPTLEGFPADLLPAPVRMVLHETGFRVIARLDDRRIWMEYSGIEMGAGTAERPDFGMEPFSIMLEAGIFGMHMMKHVLRANQLPYSGIVYSGKVPSTARFMKELLSNCIYPNTFVSVDEEKIAWGVQDRILDIHDLPVEIVCNWLPAKQTVHFYATPIGQNSAIEFDLPTNIDIIKTAVATLSATLSCTAQTA